MPVLYDQFNRPIKPAVKPARRPLAVAPVLDSFREYVADGLTPERLATTFKLADAGDVRRQAELFEQLEERDGHLVCERDKRKNVILDGEFRIEPASDDSRDLSVAEFIEEVFQNVTDWDDDLVSLQDAVGKGYAALEIHWDVSEGQAVPELFEFIEQKRFMFTDENGLLRKYPRLLTDEDAMGVEIQPWKVLFHQYGGKAGHATRSGIYRVAAWMVLFKNYSIKDWVIFCELFGMPLRIGKYDSGAKEDDRRALASAISSIGTDAAGIISKSTEIEFIETVKTARGDLWQLLANFCNAEISKAILGQTLSAEVGSTGSYAASKTHNEVRLDLMRADGRAVATTVRNQVIRPLVGFNFGWDTPVPKYSAIFDEDEDLKSKAEWFDTVMNWGVQVPVSFVREQFGLPEPDGTEKVLQVGSNTTTASGQGAGAADQVTAKAEVDRLASAAGDVVDLLVDGISNAADMAGAIDPVRQLLERCESLEEFRDRMLEAFADMDDKKLGAAIQRGMMLAELSGRFDVIQENAENGP